jgi:tetratricopeptide (TPR) repeat protein
MERLQNKSTNEVTVLIKKLEILIVQDKITEEKLDSLQETLDKIDEGLEEPNYQLYELQSIIYYARNDKTKSLEFIEDALKLNNNVTEYSKFGALLAEIHMERFVRERLSNENQNSVEELDTESEDYEEKVLNEIDIEESFNNLDNNQKVKFKNAYKTIKNTGTSIEALGYVSLFVFIFLGFAWASSDVNATPRTVMVYGALANLYGIVLIYLGVYIKGFYRRHMQIALCVALIICLLSFSGILTLLVAIYVAGSLIKINRINKNSLYIEKSWENGPVKYSNWYYIILLISILSWLTIAFQIGK